MKNIKALNLKNMKETYINYSGCDEEMDSIFTAFREMSYMGFISRETYLKFYEWAKDLHIVDDKVLNGDEVFYQYSADSIFTA